MITAWHRRALERSGHVVLIADELPLPIYDIDTAIRFVTSQGYNVARQVPQLRMGQCWRATDGAAQCRWVRSVGSDKMSYATSEHGLPVTIHRSTWERWVRRVKAVCA